MVPTLPYDEYWATENDVNISFHCYNSNGANEITIKQGNIRDKDKMVLVATEEVLQNTGRIIQIEGHLTKYLHLTITGDDGLEISSHSKRNPN